VLALGFFVIAEVVLGPAELLLVLVFGVAVIGIVGAGEEAIGVFGVGGRVFGGAIRIVVVAVFVEPAAESVELEDELAALDGEPRTVLELVVDIETAGVGSLS
jgi:hypothetical protein